jgi:hypothetical protein
LPITVAQVHRRIRRCSPSHFISAWLCRFSFGASVLWIPATNYDQPRHFRAELLFYETDLVFGGISK